MQAELNFVVNRGERLVVYPSVAGGRSEAKSGEYVNHSVTIHDGRASGEAFTLDQQGFLLCPHTTTVADFYDDEQMNGYASEIKALVQRLTDAAEVIVFDHTRRSDDPELRARRRIREPAATAHNDYTEPSAAQRIRDLLPTEAAARWLNGRYAIINVWRPMTDTVRRSPLVLCDARSIDPHDLVITERRAPERTGEIYQMAYNPDQRWVYFPHVQRDEALVFKCFDSALDGRARFAPHTAFSHPATTVSDPPRESIESRTIVRFDG